MATALARRSAFAAGALGLGLVCGLVHAQTIRDESDWREGSTPTPPAFDIARLLLLPVQPASTLIAGIDPQTVTVGADGVVRYVFIARSVEPGGALNVSYEGIRCTSAEFRRYARWQADGGWTVLAGDAGVGASSAGGSQPGDWQSLRSPAGRHQFALARNGVCRETAPNGNAQTIIGDMRKSPLTAAP